MASRPAGPVAIHHSPQAARQHGAESLGVRSGSRTLSQFFVPLTSPLRYGFQSGYKTRVNCLLASPTAPASSREPRDSSRRFHRAPRSHPTRCSARITASPARLTSDRSLPIRPPALIAEGRSGRHGKGSSLVGYSEDLSTARARGSAPFNLAPRPHRVTSTRRPRESWLRGSLGPEARKRRLR